MWRIIALTLALLLTVNAENGWVTEKYVEVDTSVELSLDQVEFPSGYEWLVVSLQQVQVPELTQEQLAELEELMSEEHFNFVTNMIENMRMTTDDVEDIYDYGDGSTTMFPDVQVGNRDDIIDDNWMINKESSTWPWDYWGLPSTTYEKPVRVPNLPDESHMMEDDFGWNYSRHYDNYYIPMWAVISLPIAGLAFIITMVCVCCKTCKGTRRDVQYSNFENEAYPDEKKVPIV